MKKQDFLIIALPKGRIFQELSPWLKARNILIQEESFDSRKLIFDTNLPYLKLINCRSYDVPSFVSNHAADLGFAGFDVISEFDYQNLYNIYDLGIGKCRLSIAGKDKNFDFSNKGNLTIATKYPNLTKRYFSSLAIRAEIIKLHGAIELAAKLDLADLIVDLVDTGKTLKENGLYELERICQISSNLIINQASLVNKNKMITNLLQQLAIL